MKRIFRIISKIVKYSWKKYHFLIPPKQWGPEFRKFKKIVLIGDENSFVDPDNDSKYRRWLKYYDIKSPVEQLEYEPLISFVIPVYNVSRKLLSECLDSILKQTYQNFEICLGDDCSTNEETIATLKEYEAKDERIKVVYRKENGHISKASNSALELATGEFVAMMDNDDVIPDNALYEVVKVLNEDKDIDMIYTDEDKLDFDGKRCCPHFKSNYAPDTLMSLNYFCHFTILRTSLLRKIGGWRVSYEGAQDWDLFLRFTEEAKKIYHIPKILYHWRMVPGSSSVTVDSKNYAAIASKKLLEDALKRRNIEGIVHSHESVPYYWIEYLYKKEPLISIIIPTKDCASTLNACLESVYKSNYESYEVLVVDNNSEEKETFALFEKYSKKYKNFKVIKAEMEFNYAKINNLAVKEAKGDYVLLLNNDVEVITPDWLSLMVGYAMQKHIGAVGAKLIYPDKTIQHGGVVLGVDGVAGHAFRSEPLNSLGVFGRLCVPYNYSAVTAACLMIAKEKYLEVNGLNELLKVTYNDVDFCLKLQKKGYYNVFLPMVQLYHFESKSRGLENTPEKMERFKKEEKYMYDNWEKEIENDPMYNEKLSRIALFRLRTDEIKENK
jgi:glycosyltransferase involved in cell wall biosynthesis